MPRLTPMGSMWSRTPVLPHSVVDNSVFSTICLTAIVLDTYGIRLLELASENTICYHLLLADSSEEMYNHKH